MPQHQLTSSAAPYKKYRIYDEVTSIKGLLIVPDRPDTPTVA
jgi:hypothetical protein